MSLVIKNMILHNHAPFEHIELDFFEKGISVLSAVNGGGKTTILSHIADAWYEMARESCPNEFEGKENKYYRISSPTYSIESNKPQLVFIRFFADNKTIDYVSLRGKTNKKDFESIVPDDCTIKFDSLQSELDKSNNIKYCSESDKKSIEQLFKDNIITYLPSYRHEQPGYLNDPYKISINYGLEPNFSGHLVNSIEIISDLPGLANWLMDVVLDMRLYSNNSNIQTLFNNINLIFSNALSIKSEKELSIGIGQRNAGATRIQVVERDASGNWSKTIYPSIFNMSAGESALICLFCEIVKQFDKIHPNQLIHQATGIVLIDEIDKHLHIRLQKDVLPNLMQLFPNVQFIVSSHSPFIAMGLTQNQVTNHRTRVIDLDKNGVVADLETTDVFAEGYNAMIEKNAQYKAMFDSLQKQVGSAKFQIVSEGHNCRHIKKAISILDSSLLGKLDFPYSDKTGKEQLKQAYEAMFNSNPMAKYLFVWDCDFTNTNLPENEHFYKFIITKNAENTKATVGIENLYPMELFTDKFYPKKKKTNGYGAITEYEEFDKKAFLEDIEENYEPSVFQKFKPLIDKIKEIVTSQQEPQETGEEITNG
ncbi:MULTISPECIES: AAA family ATPase [Synergistaceae]|uniref:AAA family ATPase n=1 Tax=Synergistaceae TaxID=649777 RepID=UPI003AED6826|nr:AAA family ATPase [Synergistaceae bacterium DZ-S4]